MDSDLVLALCVGLEDPAEVRVAVGAGYSVGVERIELVDGQMFVVMKQDDFQKIPDGVE